MCFIVRIFLGSRHSEPQMFSAPSCRETAMGDKCLSLSAVENRANRVSGIAVLETRWKRGSGDTAWLRRANRQSDHVHNPAARRRKLAAGVRRVKGVKKLGVRLGNRLKAEEARRFLQSPRADTLKGKRDRAILALPSMGALSASSVFEKNGLNEAMARKIAGEGLAFAPAPHLTVAKTDDLPRLPPGDLLRQCPQDHFLYLHRPLHRGPR